MDAKNIGRLNSNRWSINIVSVQYGDVACKSLSLFIRLNYSVY